MKLDGINYENIEELEKEIYSLLTNRRDKTCRILSRIIAELAWRIHVLEK